jgi:hypothetical protein
LTIQIVLAGWAPMPCAIAGTAVLVSEMSSVTMTTPSSTANSAGRFRSGGLAAGGAACGVGRSRDSGGSTGAGGAGPSGRSGGAGAEGGMVKRAEPGRR